MNTARSIYQNVSYLGIAEIVSKVLQFVIMLYAAKLLTQQDFGRFSFALSISFIGVILADLGINMFLIKEISRDKKSASKLFSNALIVKSVLSVLAFMVMASILNILQYSVETMRIVLIILSFIIISTFTELFYSIFRSFEKMGYDAFLKILRMILLAIMSLFVLFSGYGILAFSYVFVFTELVIVFFAAFFALNKFIRFEFEIDWQFIKSMLKRSLPFGMAFIFGTVYFYIGSVMLSKISGEESVAVFSAAYNIALALLFIPTVYTSAIYPVLSRYFMKSKENVRLLYERSFKYLYILGLPISVGSFLLSERIIHFLYGSKYYASIIVLQIISAYFFIKFLNFLLGIMLSSIDQQHKRMIGQGITAFFSILINLILIPVWGVAGAAISTLITEILLFIIYYLFLSKSWYFFNFSKVLLKPAISVGLMAIFVILVDKNLFLTIFGAGLIYFTSVYILKGLDHRDYKIMLAIMKNEPIQKNI
jgi:O-antigen/teichoic acid export membrane protein